MSEKDPTIHRGKMALVPNEDPRIPQVIFAFPEGLLDPATIPGTISRNGITDPYRVRIEDGNPTFEVQPPNSALALDDGKPVILFDLPAAQKTKGQFMIDPLVLKDLPPDLAGAYKTPAEYAVTFSGQEVTTFEEYGFTLSWENPRDEDAYMGVILGYQLRQGPQGEVLKLETVDGATIAPVFPFYFYIVAATPSHPDPEDLEHDRGETEWAPATLTIDLTKFKKVYPGYPFGKDPSTWSFYHHPLRKDHHPDHRFIVNLAPNGQWNDNNSRSVFTLTVPTAGTQPGLLLGRYFLGIEQG